ncbi:MAG: putative DNA binding domain-containing protein [Spirochaetes bacterium]|nr:putative DNA binding domain-containing protein [Spirochaetota bacterium]
MLVSEGQLVDFKRQVDFADQCQSGELARDLLGFCNADGGLLLIGVEDDGRILGFSAPDGRLIRNALGVFIGTRLVLDSSVCRPVVKGIETPVLVLTVPRSTAAYPTLLRKDIECRTGIGRLKKYRYLKGSLFYRSGASTLVESPSGDVESRAADLRFSGAAPRTRSSFLLKEDKPGLRLYANINDRFFGRETELGELLSGFDDVRGRGTSIAGLGGIGKTELAITLVHRLYERKKFSHIYSASAKQLLLGPQGVHPTEPVFTDFPTFLADLLAWLGVSPSTADVEESRRLSLQELARLSRVLLFVDNLETIADPRLFEYLDTALPSNCWLVVTGRVHRVRRFLFPKELAQLAVRDAARLLRYELKRHGLSQEASLDVSELEKKAEALGFHPLALRWYAWACSRDLGLWQRPIERLNLSQIEEFCVGHTLGAIGEQAQRVLASIPAIMGTGAEATFGCIEATTQLPRAEIDAALYELECAGLAHQSSGDKSGDIVFGISRLAEGPAAELGRTRGWEREYAASLRRFISVPTAQPVDPLLRDLLSFPLWGIKGLTTDERADMIRRIARAQDRCPKEQRWMLLARRAECERHLQNPVTADDLYRSACDAILTAGPIGNGDKEKITVLLEGATVACHRAKTTDLIARAVCYLTAIEQTDFTPLRTLGMLAELHALLGEHDRFEQYRKRALEHLRQSRRRYSAAQLNAFEGAMARGAESVRPRAADSGIG